MYMSPDEYSTVVSLFFPQDLTGDGTKYRIAGDCSHLHTPQEAFFQLTC